MLQSLNKEKTVLLWRWTSIGDVVLSTSAINCLYGSSVPVKIIWISQSPSSDLLIQSFPHINVITLQNFLTKSVFTQTLKESDIILDLQGNFKSFVLTLIVRFLFFKPVFRIKKYSLMRGQEVLKAWMRRRKAYSQHPSSHYYYKSVIDVCQRAFGQSLNKDAKPKLCLPNPFKREIYKIGVAPGASYVTKKAPAKIFADIIKEIFSVCEREKISISFFFLGSHSEKKDVHNVIDLLPKSIPWENSCGSLNLVESSEKVGQLSCVLGNDSSIGHIAEAQGVPSFILFGPTIEKFGFAPHLEKSAAFSSSVGCRPCSKHGSTPCRYGDKLCFINININSVVDAVLKLLKSDSYE